MSGQTLLLYLQLHTQQVEGNLSTAVPQIFSVVFDGWSSGDAHNVGIFANFPFDNSDGFKLLIFAI